MLYKQYLHKNFVAPLRSLRIYEQLSNYMETFLSFIFCGFRMVHNAQHALFKLLHY